MTRSSFVCGLLGLVGVGLIGALPLACQSGGVGDPCVPEDEYDPQFPGFKLTLENIESRSFQCQTRICLAYHFQGRVSCPFGQAAPTPCTKADGSAGEDGACDTNAGEKCTKSAPIANDCATDADCPGSTCDKNGHFCLCTGAAGEIPPAPGYVCDVNGTHQFQGYFCHKPNNCQQPADQVAAAKDNCGSDGLPKDCCIPGTDQPVGVEVCGQCNDQSKRDAAQAVYCSCRCDVDTADNQPKDPNFNFCTCPTGFECANVRPYLGPAFGDAQLDGKYCIKSATDFDSEKSPLLCQVAGHTGAGMTSGCSGTPLNNACSNGGG
ncbi:MAG TPA: hypothetical protein VHB21_21660 [Minicystis sp.]|nr:hypothetical protein [Minicystis sp.]